MKYCRNCGTLLEDTHEHCIRCGMDVTIPENVTQYPQAVMETLEIENQQKKASGRIVAMIIGLVVALVALVIMFLYLMGGKIDMSALSGSNKENAQMAQKPEDAAGEEVVAKEKPKEKPEENAEDTEKPKSDKAVKDDEGKYYDYVIETDDAGNEIFTALLPEDLTEREFYKDYEVYSDRYPIAVNFTASTKENDVRFTYLSPRKLWYKLSETGRGRTNESDITHFMTYFAYDGPKSYLEPLLKQSYPDAKFELTKEYDVNETVVSKLDELAKAKNKELFGDIGDYAHIGENTTYANMDYESSAKIYEYEITLKDKNMLFCRYYVPSMAHNLTYANTDTNDRGNITEWYNFAIVCFETGNEDNFDDYEEDFNIFVANALPTDKFMFMSESYCKEIKEGVKAEDAAIEASIEAAMGTQEEEEDTSKTKDKDKDKDKTSEEGKPLEPLDKAKLEKLGKDYKSDSKLDEFDSSVMDILRSAGATAFSGDGVSVYGNDKAKVAYCNKTKNKVFISPGEDEYPGDEFDELQKNN